MAISSLTNPLRYARNYVRSQTNPQIAYLRKQAAIKGAADANAVKTLTTALAGYLSKIAPNVRGNYLQAQQSQAAMDEQLHNALVGSGQNVATGLAAKLAQIGAPQTGTAQQALANAGGAANAGLARGSASLAQLISQGAGQTAYAQTLPGIAALQGQQNLAALQKARNATLTSQIGSINAGVPGLIQNILNQILNRNLQMQIAQNAGLISQKQINATNQRSAASIGATNARAAATRTAKQRSEQAKALSTTRESLFGDARDLAKGETAFNPTTGKMETTASRSKTQAYNSLLIQYVPTLIGLGYSRSQARRMVLNAVTAAYD